MRAIRIAKSVALALLLALVCPRMENGARAQSTPKIHVEVDMVQLNVAVTDNKGAYVTGLRPSDFTIMEDGISQKVATYSEGNEPVRRVSEIPAEGPRPKLAPPSYTKGVRGSALMSNSPDMAAALAGANVYILFDKSDYMYRGFVFAQDAISDFIRSLDGPDRIAFYSYSRDLSRDSQLTPDRFQVLRGVRATTAGDSAALYNALLMTLKDARQVNGRKVVVVFSNGPDNASMVAPEDVGELAQSEGVPIYMISTREAKSDPASAVVFERMAAATGGKAYFANNWRDQQKAFASIRDDLAHLYSLAYYPQANPNRGWRAITVKLNGEALRKYHVRTRSGYRPLPTRTLAENNPSAAQE